MMIIVDVPHQHLLQMAHFLQTGELEDNFVDPVLNESFKSVGIDLLSLNLDEIEMKIKPKVRSTRKRTNVDYKMLNEFGILDLEDIRKTKTKTKLKIKTELPDQIDNNNQLDLTLEQIHFNDDFSDDFNDESAAELDEETLRLFDPDFKENDVTFKRKKRKVGRPPKIKNKVNRVKTEPDLLNDEEKAKEIQRYHCIKCAYSTKKSTDMTRHMLRHKYYTGGEEKHFCIWCEKGFKNIKEMRTHVTNEHASKTHECPECYVVYSGSKLKDFERHVCNNEHVCIQCGKYSSKYMRTIHW